jgi:hypothetical protein
MKLKKGKASWKFIEELGWSTWTSNYRMIKKYMQKTMHPTLINDLGNFAITRVSDLYGRIEQHESVFDSLNISSDDGLNDVLNHIVGLGQAEYEKCMKNPLDIEKRFQAGYGTSDGYSESFAYVFNTQ